jgi:hypothetical protein
MGGDRTGKQYKIRVGDGDQAQILSLVELENRRRSERAGLLPHTVLTRAALVLVAVRLGLDELVSYEVLAFLREAKTREEIEASWPRAVRLLGKLEVEGRVSRLPDGRWLATRAAREAASSSGG